MVIDKIRKMSVKLKPESFFSISPGPGPDRVKLLCEYISIPLCEIINESFVSGIFPDPLKLAKVIPLYKKQSPDDPSNYRPISLLSIFSKIIEKLMYNRLYNFFEDQNLLYSLQFGFRAKHSTLHALISMT